MMVNPVLGLVSGMAPTPAAVAGLQCFADAHANDVLLCGPTTSYRSSLALHFALHHIARSRLPALFLCRQDGLEQNVPLLPHSFNGDDPSLHMLHIKHISTSGDLQRFASCLHLLQSAYSAIVLEDITSFVRGDDRNTLVRTLAVLLDGVRAYRACGFQCPLLVTDSSDEARRPRYIYDRWLPMTISLSRAASPLDGMFTLSVASSAGQVPGSLASRAVATGAEVPEGAAASARSSPCCWYRASGGQLVLEAVRAP